MFTNILEAKQIAQKLLKKSILPPPLHEKVVDLVKIKKFVSHGTLNRAGYAEAIQNEIDYLEYKLFATPRVYRPLQGPPEDVALGRELARKVTGRIRHDIAKKFTE